MKRLLYNVILLSISFACYSCGAYKVNLLFRTGEDFNNNAFKKELAKAEANYVIKKFDYIRVEAFTNDGAVLFDPIREFPFKGGSTRGYNNNTRGYNNMNYNLNRSSSYNYQFDKRSNFAIDENGNTILPRIGQVHLEGLKLYQADSLLSVKFEKFFQDPYIKTSYVNKRIVVMGALGNKVIPLKDENITLIEVLAIAGDISVNVKANRIRLIRGVGTDNVVMQNIDLTTWQGLQKAELIIRPNDVVYVEPRRRVGQEFISDISTILRTLSSILTVTVTTFLLIDRLTGK